MIYTFEEGDLIPGSRIRDCINHIDVAVVEFAENEEHDVKYRYGLLAVYSSRIIRYFNDMSVLIDYLNTTPHKPI